jgi:hypothetical protein
MTFPAENQAHLDPDFAAWTQLIEKLILLGQQDDRYVILDGEIDGGELARQVRETTPLYADFRESDAMGGHSLMIVYQREVREKATYLQLASGRFMLEIALDASRALKDVFLSLSDSEADGMPYPLKPMSQDRDAMLAFLFSGKPVGRVEVE